jgi:hypothetical protein
VYTEFESASSPRRLSLGQANWPLGGADSAILDLTWLHMGLYAVKVHMMVTLHLRPVGAPLFCEEQDAPEGAVS